MGNISVFRSSFGLGWIVFLLVLPISANGQDKGDAKSNKPNIEFDTSILNDPPFDVITIKKESGGDVVRVFAIDFPDRKIPTSPEPSDSLTVTMLKYPGRKYTVKWKDIEKIELYEELVMRDCKSLMDAKQYAAAFEHLNYLLVNHPRTPKLAELYQDFLERSAREMYDQGRIEQSLAFLEEYHRAFPNSRPQIIRKTISSFSDKLISKFVEAGELRIAQKMIKRLKDSYRPTLDVVESWEAEFTRRAESHRESALRLREEGKLKEARKEAVKMLALVPDISGGTELLDELIAAYPMIRVGVFQRSDDPDPTSITDWASRRSGLLTSEPLFEFRSTGSEGGVYKFTQGVFHQSDDRKQLELEFRPKDSLHPVPPLEVSQWILRRSDPSSSEYRPSWAAIFREISQDGPLRLILQLRRPHVLPHALLQWQIREMYGEATPKQVGSYRFSKSAEDELSFLWAGTEPPASTQPVEIVEKLYQDSRKARSDFLRGDLDVIDQLYPADARSLEEEQDVAVDTYALPSIHMLVPRSQHRYLQELEFRRALIYATNRKSILEAEILSNHGDSQSQLISGPFPKGKSDSDPLSYAYNKEVPPLAFDQRLSKVLVMLTQEKLKAMEAKRLKQDVKEAPPIETIRLGVPDQEAMKTACVAFVQQWNIVGIPAEMVVLPQGKSDARDGSIDLLYVAAAIWEPATDAERIFGPNGFAATNDPYIVQSLAQLRSSRNWQEMGASLQDMHTLVDAHLPVLPLWQITDFVASKKYVKGFAKRPMSLYQDMERWRIGY